jgi:hypothetical protein
VQGRELQGCADRSAFRHAQESIDDGCETKNRGLTCRFPDCEHYVEEESSALDYNYPLPILCGSKHPTGWVGNLGHYHVGRWSENKVTRQVNRIDGLGLESSSPATVLFF